MKNKGMSFVLGGLLLVLTLPGLVGAESRRQGDPNQTITVDPITFTDDAGAICEVKPFTFGPDFELPPCGEEDTALCREIGCPRFDYIDKGTTSGDINGDLHNCAQLEPTVGDGFVRVTACLQIKTDDKVWRGPSTVTFKTQPNLGGLGAIFLQDEDGSTIRATLTTLTLNPLSSLNHGIIVHRKTR